MYNSFNYKALITITSCNRIFFIKRIILPYISFCNLNSDFNFLLALDGYDQDYIDFCDQYKIPLLYSDRREGVGLSKNRVLKQFPSYKYYFFLEDDIELYNSDVFIDHIEASLKYNIHHFSLSQLDFKILNSDKIYDYFEDTMFGYAKYGGAVFNFFTQEALKRIGGWHPLFSKYCRYGHTEHSYRVYKAMGQKAPFIFYLKHLHSFIWHDPSHVTQVFNEIENGENKLNIEEQLLIDQKLSFYPVTTLSDYHFNGYDMNYNEVVARYLKQNKRKYPLVRGFERLKCYSDFYFFKFTISKSFFYKLFFLFMSFACNPFNNQIKHLIKSKMGLI